MSMTMTMKFSSFDINHINTMIGEKELKNNVVNEQGTMQNNIECRYRRPAPQKIILIAYKLSISYIHTTYNSLLRH